MPDSVLAAGLMAMAFLAVAYFVLVPAAFAGRASAGELFFYPCDSCHPVRAGQASAALPNGFKGHQVTLEVHDRLGKGDAACLVCHDDPSRDPGKLKLIDGTLIDIQGDVSALCYRCHSAKHKEWQAGVHGNGAEKCTSAGCHDPHSPSYIYAGPLLPFTGSGFQARAVVDRRPFTPLAASPVPPPVETPAWLSIAVMAGLAVVAGSLGFMTLGRSVR